MLGRDPRHRTTAETPAGGSVTTNRPELFIGRVALALGVEVVLHPLSGDHQSVQTVAGDRLRGLPTTLLVLTSCVSDPPRAALPPGEDLLGVKRQRLNGHLRSRVGGVGRFGLTGVKVAFALFTRASEELTPALPSAQLHRQLITTRFAVKRVLRLIGRLGFGEDLPGDLREIPVRGPAGVARQPGPVDRDHPRLDQAGLIAQPEDLPEQITSAC